jgi:hypothetical protein
MLVEKGAGVIMNTQRVSDGNTVRHGSRHSYVARVDHSGFNTHASRGAHRVSGDLVARGGVIACDLVPLEWSLQ